MYQQTSRSIASPSVPALLGQVLGITGGGFLVTALAVLLFPAVHIPWFLALVALFGLSIGINATSRNAGLSLILFYVLAAFMGLFIAPVVSYYARIDGGSAVYNAAGTTAFGMLVLAGVAFVWSIDWRRFSGLAFGALIVLVLAGIVSAFFRFLSPTTYSWLTLGVFTLLVLVDFSRIRAGGDGLTAVQLATSIYMDAINIFLALLQLFGGRSRN